MGSGIRGVREMVEDRVGRPLVFGAGPNSRLRLRGRIRRFASRSYASAVPILMVATALSALAGTPAGAEEPCRREDFAFRGRNPSGAELRCRYEVRGPGRFGLLSYVDVPVYQPATPMPGTHIVGVPGHASPLSWESYEAWEWRVLRTGYGPEARVVHRSLDVLDPIVAGRIAQLEARLAEEGVRAVRRETWRSPYRQAYLFQQGRSRPGPLATTTLTSWHSQVDVNGHPAGRAVDYDVAGPALRRFHEIAHEVGLESFGHDSHDPGHVFLPLIDGIDAGELALLRTLPRVPEVTLATGLPVDRPLPEGGRARLHEAAAAFAAEPFIPFVTPRMAPGFPLYVILETAPAARSSYAAGDS